MCGVFLVAEKVKLNERSTFAGYISGGFYNIYRKVKVFVELSLGKCSITF